MRKLLLLVLIILSVYLGYSYANDQLSKKEPVEPSNPKTAILRFALVSDSENENKLLAKALSQAKGAGVNFVIGLGDWSSVGTINQLSAAKKVFGQSGLTYYITAGDHDLWDSRNRGQEATSNFRTIFGSPSHVFQQQGIQFVILDNSDIYLGIDSKSWDLLKNPLSKNNVNDSQTGENSKFEIRNSKLTFVFAHKTPFHPQSSHVMGEQTNLVKEQAMILMDLLEEKKVDGFFSGDLHFFARFNSPEGNVKMTTIGAVNSTRNFQGSRFAIVTIYSDYSWEVEDVEIR